VAHVIRLLEHEGKALLRARGIPVPAGALFRQMPADLDGPLVVKAQIFSGGRGKAGGIRFANGRAAAVASAAALAGETLAGEAVEDVYVEQRLDIAREYYLAALVDRDIGMPVLLVSADGGVDIEQVAPERLLKQRVDPLIGLQPFMVERLVRGLGLADEAAVSFRRIVAQLYTALIAEDAELIEINPLVLTGDGRFVAADAKVMLDEDAAFRHPGRRAQPAGTAFELAARTLDVIGVEIARNRGIAAIMNGAGLTMATLDEIIALGGTVSGVVELHGATSQGPEHIAEVIACVLRELDPVLVLVNVHFQFRSLATIAEGVALAMQRLPALTPDRLVLRLRGEKAAEARAILAPIGVPIEQAFGAACARAVELAGRRRG
jgi:succinyl-CoA synthetase beta subunit